jgi:hypothetical protein
MGLVLLLALVATKTLRGQALPPSKLGTPVLDAVRSTDWASLWQERVANFYISDRNSGKRFYVRAGEGAKITPMTKLKTINFDGDGNGVSVNLKNWMASNDLSCNGAVRFKEG